MNKLTFYILLFCTITLIGQQGKLDSLKIEFKKAVIDTTKASILADIGIAAYYVNLDLAKKYNDSLIAFSLNVSNKYLIQGYRMQGTFSLLESEYNESEKWYVKALTLAKESQNKRAEANLLENLATLYVRKNQYEQALIFYDDALQINEELNNQKANIGLYLNMSVLFTKSQDVLTSSNYLIKALEIAEKTNSPLLDAVHQALGATYIKLLQYEKAEYHLDKALNLAKKEEDIFTLASTHQSLSVLFDGFYDDYEKALFHSTKALHYFIRLNNKRAIGMNYYGIGQHNYQLAKEIEAEENYLKGMDIAYSTKDTTLIITGHFHLAELFASQGSTEKANSHITRAKELNDTNSSMYYKNHYWKIGNAFAKSRLFHPAYENVKSFAVLSDSLYKKNGVEKVIELETKYLTEKKEKENLQLIADNSKQSALTQKENTQKWIFGLVSLIAILTLLFFSKYTRSKKRQLLYNSQLEIIKAKQNEHEEIGIELHDNISKELEIISLALIKDGNDFLSGKVAKIKEEIRGLSRELSVTTFEESSFKEQVVTLAASYQNQKTEITINGLNEINWSSIANPIKYNLFLIIREAISNGKNHSQAKNINLTFKKIKKEISVSITDNGIGFDKTSIRPGRGLRNMKIRVGDLKGNLKITSEKSKGTQILIRLALV